MREEEREITFTLLQGYMVFNGVCVCASVCEGKTVGFVSTNVPLARGSPSLARHPPENHMDPSNKRHSRHWGTVSPCSVKGITKA